MIKPIKRLTAAALWHDLQNIKQFKARTHMLSQTASQPFLRVIIQSLGGRYINVGAPDAAIDTLSVAGTLCIASSAFVNLAPEKILASHPFQRKNGIKVVLDLGDIRQSDHRKMRTKQFLKKYKPTIIRGDIWDIFDGFDEHKKIFGKTYNAEWKEGVVFKPKLRDTAEKFAKTKDAIVVLSDEETILTDGTETFLIHNNHKSFHKALSLHQLESALIGLFMEVNEDPFIAAAHGLICLSLACEAAAVEAKGPGTFAAHLQDAFFNMTLSDITHRWRFNALATRSVLATAELKMAQKPR